MAVDFRRNVYHGYLSKEFGEVLLRQHVVLIDHFHPNFFFDFLLSFDVSRVRSHESLLLREFLPLALHLLGEALRHQLLQQHVVLRRYRVPQLRVLVQDVVQVLLVVQVMLFQRLHFLFNSHCFGIVKCLVKEIRPSLSLRHYRLLF